METITIIQYLDRKGIEYRKSGTEIVTKCLFGDCDHDSRQNEGHLYFNTETSQYDCEKCGAQGNIVTLCKHLGDDIAEIQVEQHQTATSPKRKTKKKLSLTSELVESMHTALPQRLRLYLNQRGISDLVIDSQKIGWGEFYGRFWLVIPVTDSDGSYALLKLRKDPEDTDNKVKMMVYPKGAQHQIYGWEMLKDYVTHLVICEGEFDRLVLLANGVPAVTSTGGAGTFKEDWPRHFLKAENVYVCYDRDEAGESGAEKVLSRLHEIEHESIYQIVLPEMDNGGKDITDYFLDASSDIDTFMALAKKLVPTEVSDRVVAIQRPYKPTSYTEWKEVIKSHFPELAFPAEICLSIISQVLVHEITNPFALVLVGVPSGGKTICINFFDAIEELTYATDKFTPASFVSNASNVKREKLAEIDLLPRIRHKAFLVRDLATLFSKRDDDLNECLGILTRVLDGEGLSTDTGIHGRRNLSGAYLFMMIAASTPIPTRIWKMMGSLGSRLFFYSMQSKEKDVDELVAQLKSTAFKQKEKACRIATRNLLYTLWDEHKDGITWNRDTDPDEIVVVIARCAKLLAKLRGVISVWKEKKHDDGEIDFDYTPPIIENPDRISMLFYNLCRGHAVATGRQQIGVEDLRLIVELAIDSAPTTRANLFRELIDHGGSMTTSQIELSLDCSKPTALKEMRTLEALGVCEIKEVKSGQVGQPENRISLKSDFEWFCSNECRNIRGVAHLPMQDTLSDLVD